MFRIVFLSRALLTLTPNFRQWLPSSGAGSQPARHPLRLPLEDVSAFCHLFTEKFPDCIRAFLGKPLMRDSATFDAQWVIAVVTVVTIPHYRSRKAVLASRHFVSVCLRSY